MKQEYINALSIVIPTYNRKKELKRLLNAIFKEDLTKIYEIVIVNNCSDYNIEEVTQEFNTNKIRIQNNPFNVRMATNMMNSFLYCRTKWMWLISDDDVIKKGALDIVFKDIKENKSTKTILLKYSTQGTGVVGKEKNVRVNSLEQYIDYYYKDKPIRRGNIVFISNNVFNLENLYTYIGLGFEFSYTYIPFLIPVIVGLSDNLQVQFREKEIIQYENPGSKFWSFKTVGLGLSTITHIPLKLPKDYKKKLYNILMVAPYKVLITYLLDYEIEEKKQIFDTIYNSCYKYYLKPKERFFCSILSFFLQYPKLLDKVYKLYKKR